MNFFSITARPVPILLIILMAALLWGGQYASRSLWEPDEARYTYVAWEMHESGNWLVPHRHGETYAHKPPLMFWLINISTLFTNGEFDGVSGRMPTFLGIILSLWAVSRLTALWYNRQTAWYAIFILSTSYLFWHKAGTGQIDVLLLGLQLSALYLLFKNETQPSRLGLVAAFSLMGLAILAKGPVGLIVPVGIYVTASLTAGNKACLARKFWLWGIPLSLVWPGAWLFAAWLFGASADYFNELLFTQNVGRFAGEFGGHYKPFYYYLKYLVIDFLPWTFLIPAALWATRKDKSTMGQARRILGWVLFVVVFFSLAGGKRNLYILSVYPALSMLVASVVSSLVSLSPRWRQWTTYPLVILFALFSIAGLAPLIPWPGFTLPLTIPVHLLLLFSLISAGTAVILYRCQGKEGIRQQWVNALIATMIIVECYVGTIIFPLFNPIKSPTALAHAVESTLPVDGRLILYRMNGEILALYSKRQGIRFNDLNDLEQFMNKTGHGIVSCTQKEWEHLEKKLAPDPPQQILPHFFKMGGKSLMWFKYGK
ncbi:ArnT [Desulforapulum autotrophicum HRM2]|uniref:ArnT n=1 Tax=Desulforapulum autotrophicum (strain ATCC 43914 / DSM 3382 / VKM B-1955 / HRM2) TaxID=177437 RepID=C0QBS1_DESAH|nr:glycosyltransferase family 39 protein [Desulforapulum autotrophicum]ACN14933.1 ArnT [Desulforapulum autotrophicum HRM2]